MYRNNDSLLLELILFKLQKENKWALFHRVQIMRGRVPDYVTPVQDGGIDCRLGEIDFYIYWENVINEFWLLVRGSVA